MTDQTVLGAKYGFGAVVPFFQMDASLQVPTPGGPLKLSADPSMSRNPIAAYTHRGGFRLGAEVAFKDFLWEALYDPAPGVDMITTADNLARRHGLSREAVDRFALDSHQRALQAQIDGWFEPELVALGNERFELAGYQPRNIQLQRGVDSVTCDSHPRPTDLDSLRRLRAVHAGGVQTAGNTCAVVDGAAAALVGRASAARCPVLAHLLVSAVVGVAPEFMGIGPAPAIQLLLQRSGLALGDIGLLEINEGPGGSSAGRGAGAGTGRRPAKPAGRLHRPGTSFGGHGFAPGADPGQATS